MSGWRIRFHDKWPHMSSLYSGGSSREDEEQKYVEPGSVFDNVYENPSEPYGAYKFYMAPREEFVIQSEPHLYPVRALYKEDDDRTSGYATSGGSNSLKDGSSKRILLCVFLVFLLICAVIAAVVMAVLISHQRRMKPLQPDHQQQDVLESNIRITNRTFITEYSDPSSPQYKLLETEFCKGIDAMFFRTDSPMKEEYKGCKVLSFRAGSVFARYLLMFVWKDKKPLHPMVDQIGDFIKETIPKKGIWNPLLLNGESLNLYPVEITNLEPTLYPPKKEPTGKDVTKDVTEEIISISSQQNIYPTDRVSFGRTNEITTPASALSSHGYSTSYLSERGAAIPSYERSSDRLMSTFRADDKLYPSESVRQPESEILATVLWSSKSILHSPENIPTIYSDEISKQFSKMPTFSSISGSKMDVLPTHSDAMSPTSESKIPINSVRANIDSYLQSLMPILPTTKQPLEPKDPLKEFKSKDDFFNFFNRPQPPTTSIVKDQNQDRDLDLLLSNGGDLHKFLFPSLDQATLSTTVSEKTSLTTSVTTPTEPLQSFQFNTMLTTSDYIDGPSLQTFQMVKSSILASETYDQTVYTDAIPSALMSMSSMKAAQTNIDKPLHSVLPAFSQKTQTSDYVLANLKPSSQTYFQTSSLSISRSSTPGITSPVGVTPSILTFGSDGDLFSFFSDASHLGTPPPEISRFSLGDPKLHTETDKTQSFGGFGDFFSQISEIEGSVDDMLPPNVLMASADSARYSSAFHTQDLKSNSERILDTVAKRYPSTSSIEYSERNKQQSDWKLENIEDTTYSLQSSMTSIIPEKRQEHGKSDLNSEYGNVYMSTAQKLVSTPEDINTSSDVREHDIQSLSSIQTDNVEMLEDRFLETLVKSMTPSASYSGMSVIKDGIIDEKITLPFSSKQQNTLSIKMVPPTESVKVLPQSKPQSIYLYSEDRNLEFPSESFVAISSAVHLQNFESKKPLNVDHSYSISSENTVFLSTISLENTGSNFGEKLIKASYPVHDTSDLYSLSSTSYSLTATTPLYKGIQTSSLSYDPISKEVSSLKAYQSSAQPSKLVYIQGKSYLPFSPSVSDKMYDLKSSSFLNVASDLFVSINKQTTTPGFQDRTPQNSLDFSIRPSLKSAYEFSEQSLSNSDGLYPLLSIQEGRSSIKPFDDSRIGEDFRTETQLSYLESSEFKPRNEETMSTLIVLPTPSVDSISKEQISSQGIPIQEVFSSNLNMNTLYTDRVPTSTRIVYAESMKNTDARQITNTSTVKSEVISSEQHILPSHFTPIDVFSDNTEIGTSGVSSILRYTEKPQSFSSSHHIRPSERIIKDEISLGNSPTERLFPETSRLHLHQLETLSEEEIKHSKSLESYIKSSTSHIINTVALENSAILPDVADLKRDSTVSSETIQSSFKPATLEFGSFSQLNSFSNIQLQPTSPIEILGYSSSVRDFMVSEEMIKSVKSESKSPMILSDVTTRLMFSSESVEVPSNNQHTDSLTLNKFSGIQPDSMTSELAKLQNSYSIQAPNSHSNLFSVNPTSVLGLDRLSREKQLESTAIHDVFYTSSYNQNVRETTAVSSNLLSSEIMINMPSEAVSNKFSHFNMPDMSQIKESISTHLGTVVLSTFTVEPSRDIVDKSFPLDITKTQDPLSSISTVKAMDEVLRTSYPSSTAESLPASSVNTAYKSEILDNLLNQFLEQSNTAIKSITDSLTKSSEASIVFLNTDSYASFGVSVSDILSSSSVKDPLTYTINQELATEPLQGQLTLLPNLASVTESIKSTVDSLGLLSTDKLMRELTSDVSTSTFVPTEDNYSTTEQTKDIGQTAEGTTQTLYHSKPKMMLKDTLSTDLLNVLVDRASQDSFNKQFDSMNSSKITSTGLFQISETRVSSFATSYSSYQLKSLLDAQTYSMFMKDSSLSNIESPMSIEGLPISNILKDFPSKTQNFVNSVILESSLIQKTKSRDFSSSLMHSKPLDNLPDLQPSRQQLITTSTITSVPSVVFDQTTEGFLDLGSIKPIHISSTDEIQQTYNLRSDIETIGIQSSSTNDIHKSTVTIPEIDIVKEMETIQTLPLESGHVISRILETAPPYSSYVKSENIDTSITSSNTGFQQINGLNTIGNLEQFMTPSYTSSSKSEQLRMVDYYLNDSTVQPSVLSTRAHTSSLQPSRLSSDDIPGESFLKQTGISSFILPNSEMLNMNNFTAPAIPTVVQSTGSILISSSALISDIQTMDGNFKNDVMYSSSPFIHHVSDQRNISEPDLNQLTHTMSLDSTLTMFSNVLTSDFIVSSKTLVNTLTPTNPLPSIPFFQSETPLTQTLVRESTTVISENILPSTIQQVTITESTNDTFVKSIQRNDSLLITSEIFPTKASSNFSSTASILNYTSFNLADSLVIDPHPSGNIGISLFDHDSIDTFILHSSSVYESIKSLLSSKSENYSQIAATPGLFPTFGLTTMLEGGEPHVSSQTLSVPSIQHMTTPLLQSEFSLIPSILSSGNILANLSRGAGLELPDISSKMFGNLSVLDASTTDVFSTKVETQYVSILSNFTQHINQLLASEMQTVSSTVPIYTQTDSLEDNTWSFTISQTLEYNNTDNASSSLLSPTQTDSYFSSAVTKSIEPKNSIVQTPIADTSPDVVAPIKEDSPSVNPDSQTNAPIQTTPYDVSSDFLVPINEEIPSLNLDSQTIDPNSPINSNQYLLGSGVIFSSLGSSILLTVHEFVSQSSAYQSSIELTHGKNTVNPISDKFSKTTLFETLSMISVDDSSVLFGELLSYGKGISSQTSAISSTNDPSVTVLDVSSSLLFPMLSDSFSEKHVTNAMFLTSIPDHSLFAPQSATISYLSFPELTTEINSAGSKKMGKIRVEQDDISQENMTLRSISPDIAGIHKSSGVLEDYFTNVGMNENVSHSGNNSLRFVTIDGNERYSSTSLGPIQHSTQYLLPYEHFGDEVNIASSNMPSQTISNSYSQSISNRVSSTSRIGNDLRYTGNIIDEIRMESESILPFSNKLSSVSLDLDNTHDLYSEISISVDSLTQISINTNAVWSTEIKSSFSYDAIQTIVPSKITKDGQQTNLFKTSDASALPGSSNDVKLSNYILQESIPTNSLKFLDTMMHQSDSSSTTFKLYSSMPYPSVELFSHISSMSIHPSQTQIIPKSKSWSSNSFNNHAEVLRNREVSFDATKLVQNETSTVQATLVPHTYPKSTTSVTRESSADTFLFTAANDYDYYATNLDFVTDYVDFTAPKVIDIATISTSSSVSHSSTLNNLPLATIPSELETQKSPSNLQNPVKDNRIYKPAGGLPFVWPVVGGDLDSTKKRKQTLQATGEAENVIEPVQRLPKTDVKMTTPLITSMEQFVSSSSIPSDMDYDDPFAAFFGARGPAIPQWVIDMLGSVHDSPSSTAKLYFRH